ncbi:MAG: hypothetical protein HY775_12440 [Acidobacteria bacterium]|nr:hypothetical protein [Acidobacteriota bacterium]
MTGATRIFTPRRAVAGLLLAMLGAAVALPAGAAPRETSVDAVYQLPCRGSVCDSDDSPVASDAVVSGSIEIRVSSQSSIGLAEMRLDAQPASGSAVCLARWNAGNQTSFTAKVRWSTGRWPGHPSGCPASDSYGNVTANGSYTLRVTATESTTGNRQTATFPVRLANAPAIPEWAGDPSVSGVEDGAPVVTISWDRNPEPDVVEYRYTRTDPEGQPCERGCEFAVSADDPEGQGCSVSGDVYTCQDDYFSEKDYSGEYSYSLVAYRSSPNGSQCAVPSGASCVGSEPNEVRAATLEEPPPPPPPSSPSRKPSPAPSHRTPTRKPTRVLGSHFAGGVYGRGGSSTYLPGTYRSTLPYDRPPRFEPSVTGDKGSGAQLAAADDGTPGDPRALILPVAAGMLLFLAAAHMARVLLAPAAPRRPRR